jgi:serine/threonine protein phosphatase 1
MPRRTIALGDIHGCSAALAALVEALEPGPDDLIVPLGDFIDRGPDSRGVVDQLLQLSQRCRVQPILGNHEQMMLDAIIDPLLREDWLEYGGAATLDSYGGAISRIPPEHFAVYRDCLDYLETDTHIFTHACYDPAQPMSEQTEDALRWEPLSDPLPGPHHSGKVVVVGHTAQRDGAILDAGHLKCLDTFCYGGGWLTALEVGTGQIWQADRHGRLRDGPPVIRAGRPPWR